MDIDFPSLLQIASYAFSALFAALTVWYQTNKETDKKIETAQKAASDEIAKVRDDLASFRSTAISRQEHDRAIDNVKQETRAFRDEVREDIRTLNATLTARFDLMMQKMFELRTIKD